MYKGGPKRMEDYRLVVTKTMQRGRGTGSTWSGAGAGASAGSIGAVRQTAFRPPVVTQHPSTDGEAPTMAMAPEGGPSGMYGKLLGLKGRGGGRGGRGGRSGAGRGGRGGGSSSQGGDGGGSSVWVVELGLWLLNPAVTFGEVAGAARAVILTSGTLAPIESFASELGTSFDVQLEAPHVVDMKRQVWAGIIDAGPSRLPLNASYRTADTYDFQDQLGAVLLATCQVAPGGVLVFLPSYSLLDKLEGASRI
jgi:Fanconi anemia group J protein